MYEFSSKQAFYNVAKCSIHQRILKKNASQFPQNIKQFWTLIIIRQHVYRSNQPIRIISEGSCDTEDWSNDVKFSFASQE